MYQLPEDKVLALRTCNQDMTSWDGFVWPTSGYVEALDWKDNYECVNGLHGLLWGEGDGDYLDWWPTAKWLVVEIGDYRKLGDKIKFPSGNVVHCGDQESATDFIAQYAPGESAILGRAV